MTTQEFIQKIPEEDEREKEGDSKCGQCDNETIFETCSYCGLECCEDCLEEEKDEDLNIEYKCIGCENTK